MLCFGFWREGGERGERGGRRRGGGGDVIIEKGEGEKRCRVSYHTKGWEKGD
jgi:hypothetical protein